MHIIAQKSTEIFHSDKIPVALQRFILPGTTPIVISGEFGNFLFQELKIPDANLDIVHSSYLLEKEDRFQFLSEHPALRLQIHLSNDFLINLQGLGKRQLKQESYNMFYVPSLNSEVNLTPGREYQTLNICFNYNYLSGFSPFAPRLQEFLEKVLLQEPALLFKENQILSAAMKQIIQEILESHHKGSLRMIFLETKVKELFLLVLDKINQQGTLSASKERAYDHDRLTEAKETLLKDLENPLSVNKLSRKTGLPKNTIKQGFKELFGQSPHKLVVSHRMEFAQRLITETSDTILDISYAVGYTGAPSFSKAFKKHFGHSPVYYRKNAG